MGTLFSLFWTLLRSPELFETLIIFSLIFLTAFFYNRPKRRKRLTEDDFLLYLEIKYPKTKHSAFALKRKTGIIDPHWQKILDTHLKKQQKELQQALLKPIWTLVLSLALVVVSRYVTPSPWSDLINTISKELAPSQKTATLAITKGAFQPDHRRYSLHPKQSHTVKLLSDNLVQIIIKEPDLQTPPSLLLKKIDSSHIFQSFQMQKQVSPEAGDRQFHYRIDFSLTHSLDLYIPIIDAQHKLARFITTFPQHPQVRLQSPQVNHPHWIDEKPITFTIDVTAKKTLDEINLIIQTPHKEYKETIRNFNTPIQNISIPYQLILEPYLESDLTNVILIAEAIDRSIPVPLVGYSQPIELTVVSAYGRYLKTLQTLHELKTILDYHQSSFDPNLPSSSLELMQEAQQHGDTTPFFDYLDRHHLHELKTLLQQQHEKSSMNSLYQLSQKLTQFLEEHERLNDRERDRDFLVAAQGLHAAIVSSDHVTEKQIKHIIDRMQTFLDQRHPRWNIRVNRLGDFRLTPSWQNIKTTKPFKESLSKIQQALDEQSKVNALAKIDPMIATYQSWLDELEQAEDKQRDELRKKMQDELKSIQQQLKQLQKKQSHISSQLDKAKDKDKTSLDDNWPMIKLKQTANLNNTKKLEQTVTQLAPQAGERLVQAATEMSLTIEQGEQKQFIQAESHSDAANRLLRAAHQDSIKQKKQQQQRNSRQRRRIGRKYHGRALYNSDINLMREYKVDRKYREDILDDIQKSQHQEQYKTILDNYLRRIIR